MKKHVLMPAFTVAPWGGLHENVILGAQALVRAGHLVTMVLRPGRISERARSLGMEVIEVDWDDWITVANRIRSTVEYDLILAQPQRSRELALHVNEGRPQPLFVMFHGFYSDQAVEWSKQVEAFLTVTPALSEFLAGFAKVEPWKLHVVPNGVPLNRFEMRMKSFEEKTSEAKATVLMPSRIDKDKSSQVDAIRELIDCIQLSQNRLSWTIKVLGDGPERNNLERLSKDLIRSANNVDISFMGWVDSEDVPVLMNDALFTVGAGRGAMQSMAVGTPVLAAGKHGVAGFQMGRNLRIGLWSNFGDYPFRGAPVSSIRSDFESLMDPRSYADVQDTGRLVMNSERSQARSDELLISALSM